MKLLLDQGLPRSAAFILRQNGIDAVHTGEVGLSTANDREIIEEAYRDSRVIVTLDADFHTLLALSEATLPSVIRIRIERLRGPECASLIQSIMESIHLELTHGAAVTVQKGKIRLHKLPIIRQSKR